MHGLGGGAAAYSIGCGKRRFNECVGVVWACGLTVYLPLPFMSEGLVTLSCKALQLDLYLHLFLKNCSSHSFYKLCLTSCCLGNSSVLLRLSFLNLCVGYEAKTSCCLASLNTKRTVQPACFFPVSFKLPVQRLQNYRKSLHLVKK